MHQSRHPSFHARVDAMSIEIALEEFGFVPPKSATVQNNARDPDVPDVPSEDRTLRRSRSNGVRNGVCFSDERK